MATVFMKWLETSPEDYDRVVFFHDSEMCITCGACALLCPEDAIELKVPHD
jgi:NAD-dependent dihydropyrimidine dehydrogenase PreA subunit